MRIIICPFLACFMLLPDVASADDSLPKFETMCVIAIGGCLPLEYKSGNVLPVSGFMAQRAAFPHLITWSLEMSIVGSSGIGINVLMDVIHQPRFRLHLLDPGVFINVLTPVREKRIDRVWDLTFGLGADWRFYDHVWLSAVYRMFLPDPIRIVTNYGSLIRETVNPLPKEGQLWIGVSYELFAF